MLTGALGAGYHEGPSQSNRQWVMINKEDLRK